MKPTDTIAAAVARAIQRVATRRRAGDLWHSLIWGATPEEAPEDWAKIDSGEYAPSMWAVCDPEGCAKEDPILFRAWLRSGQAHESHWQYVSLLPRRLRPTREDLPLPTIWPGDPLNETRNRALKVGTEPKR